jgi:hypothetical protein
VIYLKLNNNIKNKKNYSKKKKKKKIEKNGHSITLSFSPYKDKMLRVWDHLKWHHDEIESFILFWEQILTNKPKQKKNTYKGIEQGK